MKKFMMLGGAALVALATPLIVYAHMDPSTPIKRADVSAMVKEHFDKVDANHDGMLTMDEVKAEHEAKMVERRTHMFEMIDTNHDGSISRDEFNTAHPMQGGMHDGPGEEMSHDMASMGHGGGGHMGHMGAMFFARADTNKDGKLTLAEANSAALTFFDKVDTNKDGVVTPDERHAFREKMESMWSARHGKDDAPAH
jgi:Ca2+-binding EF-hand superfamily protein